ncbi:MAG: DUF6291 domain-containing protein [Treponema sp.]|nr:DUF6291 domain-containing protein [Treponema sp.]
MAGKYALYLPYHIITALETEGFSDTEIGTFVRGVIKYHLEGTPPKFEDRSLNLLFSSSKPEFDNNIAKYENTVHERSEAGKKGGAPKGNRNATGNRGGGAPRGNQNAVKREDPKPEPENKDKQMLEFEPEKQTQAKQADIESVVELDLGKDIDKDKSSSTAAAGGGEVVFPKQPTTTTTIFNFQKECEQLGFPITEARARSILKAGLDPAWFTGPGSVPAYIAAYVNNAYSDKAPDERLKLFLSALAWEDKQDEYRDFLEKRKKQTGKKAETESERQRKEAKRKATPRPTVCGNCGAAMPSNGELCPACNHYAAWDDEQGKYVFQERFDFSKFVEAFSKKHRHRIANDNAVGDVSQYFREA